MGLLSSRLTTITFGVDSPRTIQTCTISPSGGLPTNLGQDLGNGLACSAEFQASKVWNAVWNDIADFQLLSDKLEFGKCYYDTKDGAKICTERCQMSVIGIASDTFGFGVGAGSNTNSEVPIAVAGWVLAYVDKEYECGTPLTNDQFGNLTEMTRTEKLEFPERIVAIYKRKEMEAYWGPENHKIKVNERHWVKVK
jgi:hypothetical protein